MRCSKCQAENRADHRFCTECGAPLPRACPACGAGNDPGAKFCGACGARLAGPPEAKPEASPPADAGPPAPAGERRQVTILFADLAGFTRLSTELDAEELHALVNRLFAVIDRIVADYGGAIDKHIGDAVMALFGAPVAHGDDPLRAVRAAFDIHAAMAKLSEEVGRVLSMHVGIASGEVVAAGVGADAEREYTVLGESVNLASRLDGLAKAGQTLVSDPVWRSVAARVEGESLGDVAVKGIERPVRVWRLIGLRAGAERKAVAPLVGREAELRQFAGVLDSCREGGFGQVVYVRGEAGIGKTRLVEEFIALALARGFAAHRGLVLDFGVERGQDAVRAVVRSLLGLAPGADEEARAGAVRSALAEGWVAAEQQVFLNDLLDLPQPTGMRAMYDAMDNAARNRGKQEVVSGLVRATSRHQALVLAVEDIHWADPHTLAHLAAVGATVRDCPAILAMTSRLEGDPLDQVWRAAIRGSALLTVDVGPLRREAALALARSFIDASSRTVIDCIERAEGNPLFLEQLILNAEEAGDDRVPGSIQSLVLGRMDRLPPADRAALQAASAIGQRFALETLRHLAGQPDYDCRALIEHYLVRPEGEDYLFAHALIQEGVYSSLLKARKRELHRRLADWFSGRDPVLRAQHLDRAEDAGAARAYLEAAEAQAATYHQERALALAERGLAAASERADKFALTCLKGELLHDLGSVPASIEAYRGALALAADDAERCRAWIGLAAGMRVIDRYDEALDALASAEAAAAGLKLTLALSRIHYLRGNLLFPLGRIEGCREEHERALRYAREAASREAEARALSGLGDAEYARGRMGTAHGHFRACVALARELGLGGVEVANLSMIGFTRRYLNQTREALADAHAAIAAAARVGHLRGELMGETLAAEVSYDMAEFASARAHLERARALIRRLGAWRFEPQTLICLARLADGDGRGDEVAPLLEEALRLSRETGPGYSGPRVLGTIALMSADREARARALAEGEALIAAGAVSHNHFYFYIDAMEAALAGGDNEGVERHAAALEAFTRPEPLPYIAFFVARARALARHARGERGAETRAALAGLAEEGRRAELRAALPALERVLAGC
ncbi:MAG: AAA family ATPase [Proteobacteria bacterium]|nr:AAA family ATPase [Pseudomonadota bacterium]